MQTITLKIRNDSMAQGLLAFLRGRSEVDVEETPAPDPDFPGFDQQSWKNLAADLEESYNYFKNGGKGFTVDEVVAHARETIAKVRAEKLGTPA
jgi:hypothetical protein